MASAISHHGLYSDEDMRKRSVKREIEARRSSPDTVWSETVYACAVTKEIFSGLDIPFQVALGQY